MLHAAVRARLREVLDPDPAPEPAEGDRLAAVLAPLVLAPEPALIFTERAADLSRHAGEVSFPGGLQDPGETLVETALREAHEEIGLDPSLPDLVGALPAVHTTVSGILVVPFLGMLDRVPALTVSDGEIAEVLTVPVARLADLERPMELARPGGDTWHGWAYELGGHTIWGATGWMLHGLLELLRKETTWTR
ncbi:MAG TPA: CoA pyrophosphatase [Actinomycetota bacterium]|jgi:8-oxo-dGTP pyrophosphatase MutT (NUDIX family)